MALMLYFSVNEPGDFSFQKLKKRNHL